LDFFFKVQDSDDLDGGSFKLCDLTQRVDRDREILLLQWQREKLW